MVRMKYCLCSFKMSREFIKTESYLSFIRYFSLYESIINFDIKMQIANSKFMNIVFKIYDLLMKYNINDVRSYRISDFFSVSIFFRDF